MELKEERRRAIGKTETSELISLSRVIPPLHFKVLSLHFEEELPQAEIAEQVGISQRHVSDLILESIEMARQACAGHRGIIFDFSC